MKNVETRLVFITYVCNYYSCCFKYFNY